MAHVDMEPKLVGRAVGMTLSPLPANKRHRKFTKHGEILEPEPEDALTRMTTTRMRRRRVMQTERRLLLFDIDGTLITSGGAGEGALKDAMKSRFGVEEDLQGILLAGATDARIARELLVKHSLEATPENVTALLDEYLRHLHRSHAPPQWSAAPAGASSGSPSILSRGRSGSANGKSQSRSGNQALPTMASGIFLNSEPLPTTITTATSLENSPKLARWKSMASNFLRSAFW
jgi:hypothetical protein